MCKATVVIPNYNGEKYLVPCLASLYEETRAEIKVIVVDNGSKDDSLNRAYKVVSTCTQNNTIGSQLWILPGSE